MALLNAGALRSCLVFQTRAEMVALDGAVVSTWSHYATAYGTKKAAGFVQLLESETAAPRRAWEIRIRRRKSALPFPLRVLHGDQTLFATAALDDDAFPDQLLLQCVEGVNMGIAETATIYRGTDVIQSDRSTLRTWAAVATDVQIRLDEAEASLTQRVFGLELHAELHGIIEIDADVRLGDGIVITAGRHTGQSLLVGGRAIDPRLPAQAYYALALTRTTEALS